MTYKSRERVVGKVMGAAFVAFMLLGSLGLPQYKAAATPLLVTGAGAQPLAPAAPGVDSITLVSPNAVTIPESDDYATQVLGDPWDMNNIEDLDAPFNFTVPTISGGIWSATTTGSPQSPQQSVMLQYQNFAPNDVYNYIGEKSGVNYPIDTTRFTRLRFRMYIEQAPSSGSQPGFMLWWYLRPGDSAPCSNCNLAAFVPAVAGWHTYDVNLDSDPARWSAKGSVAGLRFDMPMNVFNNNIKFDWIRLTPASSAPVNITWNAASSTNAAVSLYLSQSSDANTDNTLLITNSARASDGRFVWSGTGVAPGVYYIHALMPTANGTTVSSSSGPLTVNTAPLLRITAPSTLSGEDFAAARLGTVWNGSNTNQFQLTQNTTPILYGTDYLQSTSIPQPGSTVQDPALFWLYPYNGGNPNIAIDTNRYRYMNIKLWLQAPTENPTSPWNAGPRMTWATDGQAQYVQTQAFLGFYNRWIPAAMDLRAIPKVPNSNPAGNYGWNGAIRVFRFDPHEEDDSNGQPPRNLPFYRIGGAHLTSQPIAGAATLIRWSALQGTGTVSLFYDTDNSGFDGVAIQGAANVSLGQGAAGWDTRNLPQGANYYVYAIVSDGVNSSRWYSDLPVNIDHTSSSTIFTDVPTNNPFGSDIANLAVRGIINGYPEFDGTLLFRPGASASRAQLSKMVVLGAGGGLVNPANPTFADVPTSSPLYTFVETAAARGVVSGYACGTPDKVCDGTNRAYFLPNNNVTRAQTAKMIVVSRGWSQVRPANPTFADVPASSPLFGYVEAAVQHGIIGGYPCGGAGEPCNGGNPYFRPNADVTRGQISKMLSVALGPFTGASNAAPAK